MYRCVATSERAFIQQVAVAYIRHGYREYVQGWVPELKDPSLLDDKLVDKYGIDISDAARAWRKRQGLANLQYIRHGRFFLLMATEGEHELFRRIEGKSLREVSQTPVCYGGYSITYRNGHPSVRIEKKHYAGLLARFLHLAVHRSAENLSKEFYKIRFQPFCIVKS